MKIKCSWCKKDMGTKEPFNNDEITHSICSVCQKNLELEYAAFVAAPVSGAAYYGRAGTTRRPPAQKED